MTHEAAVATLEGLYDRSKGGLQFSIWRLLDEIYGLESDEYDDMKMDYEREMLRLSDIVDDQEKQSDAARLSTFSEAFTVMAMNAFEKTTGEVISRVGSPAVRYIGKKFGIVDGGRQ